MFVYWNKYSSVINYATISLNSRKPLSADVVQQAMLHLQRKASCLRTAVRERDGELWFCKLDDVDIDFKELDIGTPKKEIHDQCLIKFDAISGPLWRTRLLPLMNNAPCLDPQIKKDYPYQYELFFFFHHSVIDGVTCAILLQSLVDIINKIIEGDKVDNSSIGHFVSNKEYEVAYMQIEKRLMANPEHLEILRDFTLKSTKSSIVTQCFSRPEVIKSSTNHMYIGFDEDSMLTFFSKCKNIGVHGGTGMQMIINTALVELAQDAGSNDESYTLSTNFTIDLRRYLKPMGLPILGSHAHAMASVITLEKDVRRNFWKNCYNLYKINSDLIKTEKVFEQAIGRKLFLKQVHPDDIFRKPVSLTRDYTFNNVRSLYTKFQGVNRHVQITDATGYVTLNNPYYPLVMRLQQHRGCYWLVLSYATQWLTERNAEVLAGKVSSLVDYCCEN